MILLITLPISFVALIILWLRNIRIYKHNYGGALGNFSLNVIHSYNVLHFAPNLKPLDVPHINFFNYTANLITKFVHFIIFSITSYLCSINDIYFVGIILAGVYGMFTVVAWIAYKHRRAYYNSVPNEQKKFFLPLLKASICVPIYQTLILVLLLIT